MGGGEEWAEGSEARGGTENGRNLGMKWRFVLGGGFFFSSGKRV